jgi:type VI secretion system protein ImpC
MAKTKEEAAQQVVETEQEGSLLDQILSEGRLARDEFQKEQAKDMIAEFVGQVMSGTLTMSKNMDVAINSRIAEIDRLITSQMNEIMHHEDFQKLEASWRGVHYLVKNSLTGTTLKIKLMHITKKDLLKDFERALEFDQSTLLRRSMRRSTARSAVPRSEPSLEITNSETILRILPSSRTFRASLRRRTRRS